MPSRLMPEADAIRLHVMAPDLTVRGFRYLSGFIVLLQDSRHDGGRDVQTGEIINEERTGHWLSAIGYLILLDQIGKSFKPRTVPKAAYRNSVQWCLSHWSPEITGDDSAAIYALRNALLHDYSLFNENREKPEYQHIFSLDRMTGQGVVRLPRTRWNGDFADTARYCRTLVSLTELGNLTESIVAAVREAGPWGIDVLLAGGSDELLQRYGLLIPDPTVTGPPFRHMPRRGS
jgi:hypothetical protein